MDRMRLFFGPSVLGFIIIVLVVLHNVWHFGVQPKAERNSTLNTLANIDLNHDKRITTQSLASGEDGHIVIRLADAGDLSALGLAGLDQNADGTLNLYDPIYSSLLIEVYDPDTNEYLLTPLHAMGIPAIRLQTARHQAILSDSSRRMIVPTD